MICLPNTPSSLTNKNVMKTMPTMYSGLYQQVQTLHSVNLYKVLNMSETQEDTSQQVDSLGMLFTRKIVL